MENQEQLVEEVFGAALDLPPEQWPAYLDQACHGAPDLRRTVEGLLRDHRQLGGFLADSPVTPGGASPSSGSVSMPRSAVLAAGVRLDRYTILEPLGFGGMGAVYRARDAKLERDVAIKVLAPGMLTGEEPRLRFHKEAQALARLNHPAIAAIYDVGEQDGLDYIVMECIPGQTLAARLAEGPLTVKEATAMAREIAGALEEAHEQGIVHRDLKPANVMLTPRGHVKVLDFGIAKLLAADATLTGEASALIGTPLYMSPEQVQGKKVDARTDLWSLGVLYYESLAGSPPFRAQGSFAVLRAITEETPKPLRLLRPDAPPAAERILQRALQKSPDARYPSAAAMAHDLSELLVSLTTTVPLAAQAHRPRPRRIFAMVAIVLLLTIAGGAWLYHQWSGRQWAREEAVPQIQSLIAANRPLAASLVLERAQRFLASDAQLQQIAAGSTTVVASITSTPEQAIVAIQDYTTPDGPWRTLGATPLRDVRIPKGYFRWKVTPPGGESMLLAPRTMTSMDFPLASAQAAPQGMVFSPGGTWADMIDFIGWIGPYKLPPYYVDRYEVTNAEYQRFVDSGGYEKKQYWQQSFRENGRELAWDEAMTRFRDTTGRPGPSTWVAGHYPEGEAQYPVSGVSWFEAAAYAAFVGKSLPVMAQWFQTAPPDVASSIAPISNITNKTLAPAGSYPGLGPYGTYDMAGNVREWIQNPGDGDVRFILGGSWRSPTYLYYDPDTLSSFDRSAENGLRCVRNLGSLPAEAAQSVHHQTRDFSHFKPAPENVFRAYGALYDYPHTPLNAHSEGLVQETADWREEKISYDTGYRGERMAAYLFLPKHVKPPYQTVLFFPSARVLFLRSNDDGRALGDVKFFDYIVQSGRAVLYPIYENTYERKVKFSLPGGSQNIQLTTDRYKDAARSLDYLATRPDIDSSRLAYLGVSMGAAQGVIVGTLLQDRLKTVVLLDGGYFLDPPHPGADQADFAPRLKKPVLMVNGRYDFTFSLENAQNPLFAMLGTPPENKRHVVLDTPHDVTEQRPLLVHSVLDWLDRYLGRVDNATTGD